MEARYMLAEGRGWLSVREEGPRVICQIQAPDDSRGLYKAYLRGAGNRYLLGTLIPEEGVLSLRRVVSTDTLRRSGAWPPTGGQVELAYAVPEQGSVPPRQPQWQREPSPQRLMGDRLLARSAEETEGALLRREEEGFALALPWSADRPFPMTPLFCFAHLEQVEQQTCALFYFNRRGCPVFPHKGKDGGEC